VIRGFDQVATAPCTDLVQVRLGRSKLKLEGELDRARAANLIERIESAVGATCTKTVRQSLRRAAEQWTGQKIYRAAEVWMIEDVEKLSVETKAQPFSKLKLPLHSDVRLPRAETSQHIAPKVALSPCKRGSKRGSIENLPTRKL